MRVETVPLADSFQELTKEDVELCLVGLRWFTESEAHHGLYDSYVTRMKLLF